MAIRTIGGLPVYEASISDEGCGIIRVSLVEDAAVSSDFIKYAAEGKAQKYAVTDADKHRILGCVLRADFPIYRVDADGEYYIIFRAEQIREFAERYLAAGNPNAVDLQHDGEEVAGVKMVQWFIKDAAHGINPAGFEDIADGSLFAEYQVTDEAIWAGCKDGDFNGFSVEIIHALRTIPETQYNSHTMAVMKTLMEMIARGVAAPDAYRAVGKKYGAITTEQGPIFWEGDEDLAEGMEVWSEDPEGNKIDLADGEYIAEGVVIVVA